MASRACGQTLRVFASVAIAAIALAACGGASAGLDARAGDSAGAPEGVQDATGADAAPEASGPAPVVDKWCTDGLYYEALPTPSASISAAIAAFSAAAPNDFVLAALDARSPLEAALTRMAFAINSGCMTKYLQDKSSANGVLQGAPLALHECFHFLDGHGSTGLKSSYWVNPDTQLVCKNGGSTETHSGGDTFARSRIRNDGLATGHPPCADPAKPSPGCDPYATIYLDGNPDDASFDGGDQGLDSVLEEALQYVNSLALAYAFQDAIDGSTSARDGILTFLWYIERYVRMARLQYPKAWARIKDDACWRGLALTIWGRAWMYLDATAGNGALGIDDSAILGLVQDPELLGEIQRLREAESCP